MKLAEARDLLGTAYARFTEGFDTYDLGRKLEGLRPRPEPRQISDRVRSAGTSLAWPMRSVMSVCASGLGKRQYERDRHGRRRQGCRSSDRDLHRASRRSAMTEVRS
jgi:hypothetical protein